MGDSVHSRACFARTNPLKTLRNMYEIENLVTTLVASWQDATNVFQSRRWHRVSFSEPVGLMPLNPQTFAPIGKLNLVHGRNISSGGISFTHVNPMPHTIVAITFPSHNGSCDSVMTRLNVVQVLSGSPIFQWW